MTSPTVVSTWSATSPFGIGAAALTAGLLRRHNAAEPLDRDRWPVPCERACLVPGFDARELLGPKGTRSMDRLSALAVVAAARVLRGADGDRIDGVGEDAGLVLGVNTGSAQSIMDLTRDSLIKERPELVKPGQFPNTLMNSASAQCAIWHRLRGPNTTVAAGRSSGLVALNYARRLQRSGRAEVVLCGAVEEFSVARAWLEHHAAPNRPEGALLGEGCAMLLLEPSGRPGRHGRGELAELLALEFGVYGEPEEISPVLAGCVRRSLASTRESPDRVWAVASAEDPELPGVHHERAMADALDGRTPLRLPMTELLGDTHGAATAFGLAAVLALAAVEPRAVGRTALITSVDRDGTVGCALLRVAEAAG